MTARKTIKILFISLLVVVLGLSTLSVAAADLNRTGSITVTALDPDSHLPVGVATFRLYRFATAKASGNGVAFTYTAAFKNNGMTLNNLSDAYLPMHLAAYAAANDLYYSQLSTNQNGIVTFEDLSCGAYLVVPVSISSGYLNPAPFIVSLPSYSEGEWHYTVHAQPKIEAEGTHPDTTYISVKKQWKKANNHPSTVSVTLLKDGKPVDTVTLSADNNWYYKWDALDKGHAWHVVEEVPTGYTVDYTASQNTVTITNTGTSPSDDNTDKLEQTGQLNWPIPILMMTGLLLITVGWALLNLSGKDEGAV